MKKFLISFVKAAIAVALLSTLSACGSMQSASSPNMIDYSYVPHATSSVVSDQYANPGIESELF